MYCNTDMMTDEDKEATIKNGRGLCSDEAHVDTCTAEAAQWRERGGRASLKRGRARRGTGSPGEDSVFDYTLGRFPPPQSAGSKMS